MRQTFRVAAWEAMRSLRSREYLIGLLLTPVIWGILAGGALLIQRWDRPDRAVYYVVDRIGASDRLTQLGDAELLEFVAFAGDHRDLPAAVRARGADGHIVLAEEFVLTGRLPVYSLSGVIRNESALLRAANLLLREERARRAGLDGPVQEWLVAPAMLAPVALDPAAADPGLRAARRAVAIVMYVMFIALVFSTAGALMTSVLQEKRTRMVEVLLSSIEPRQLLDGKVLGHSVLGLVQAATWVASGLLINHLHYRLPLAGVLDLSLLPVLAALALLGYLLYAALFVAAGATIPDIESAGSLQGVIIMLPMLGAAFLPAAINNPDGPVAVFGSLFPLTSPLVIMARMGVSAVPAGQVAAALVLLLLSQVLLGRAVARVFRIGMLMYGKAASPREIWRWMRTP